MRLIKYILLAVILIVLVAVALANREVMTLRLLPQELARLVGLEMNVALPVFLVLLGTFLLGLLFGFVWEWLREHKHRATAKIERRERERLEKEVRKVAPPAETGDDVLAILDGR
jgi:uncharacterized integral membrane protein